ncbi:pentatricopeptide repeat-containing protein At1g08070, chloroplastic-like [Diospyros lotus]|uniref:pentatricopeptide repeat-containing protein At1g08070, chloroplastic-like n=1 Tax=Diospyros lotus TaxID=55363 RepID=UPI00224ECDD0|nr:pentatricopeptide repeat-containing protein At1g08070, chloroplastic-like [Diospyros lotus]
MAIPLSILPAKNLATIIPQFPENPKTLILEQCKTIKDLNQIHAHLIKNRLLHDPGVAENLLESAAILAPEPMDYAVSIFDKLEEPNSPAYNIMIRGFTLKQSPNEAVLLFKEMCERSARPDGFTFPCVLKACSRLQALKEGEQIHAQLWKLGFGSNGFVENSLIHLYATCGEVGVARRLFDGMSERGIITWNSMFAGYSKSGYWQEVMRLFHEMLEMDVEFDEVTLVCVLTACGRLADIELGEWIGEYVEANGLSGNPTLMTSLVDMYAKCGHVDKARNLFDQMPRKDVVAWSAMISGYNQASRCRDALELFHEMQKANAEPNEVTMVSVLCSCTVLGAVETGKWVHSYIKKKRMKLTVTLGTALVDFYAKCGSVESAIEVFRNMPLRNVLSWTVLIQCLASNGQGKRAIKFFNLMLEKNIPPNDVTFISVLRACSHTGLVDEGRRLFVSMSRDFGIEPRIEHYGCMVDILGRAGLIEEAYQFIEDMPIKPNAIIWRTLLASCRVHKNIEIGEESLKNVVRLEPAHSGDYILLSNIYASVGRWEDASRVRTQMREKGIEKIPGCSVIELDGVVHEFFAEDNVHPDSEEVYYATENMMKEIKLAGYVPNTSEARLDAEEDDKETSVSHHSEKLAIAFGLIRTCPGTTIRISKNLRICCDCHNATKMASKVFSREIVVRDRNRFHHFKDGSCSCNDYW